jgi:hypothetical protein
MSNRKSALKGAITGLAAAAALAFAGQAMATTMTYTPTSSMPVMPYPGYTFSLNKINNGDTSTLDGFASTQATGVITMTLERCGSLKSFTIFNNINGTTNGVKTFTLIYYSQSGTVLNTQSLTVNNTSPSQTFGVPSGPLMQFVKRIDMKITASFDQHVEIREIVWDGTPGPCCP